MANRKNSTKLSGVRQRTHERVDKIMDKAESMSERGKEEIALLNEKAILMKNDVDGYIQRNPERSVLIAAGVGAVLGAILAGAMMRRKQEI
jgi:ElaB/YqjD/DUF883 family membrane-anchored ribosome-binding protein